MANGWLEPETARQLVGVIDLRGGQAVHAVAGQRHRYRPVEHPSLACTGDPQQLVGHFLSLGIVQLYLADLDAIVSATPQTELLDNLIQSVPNDCHVMIDIGWRGDESAARCRQLQSWRDRFPRLAFIAASETAGSAVAAERLRSLVGRDRVIAGLDYFDLAWLNAKFTERDWLAVLERLGIDRLLVLDLNTVGTRQGPTTGPVCRRLKTRFPASTVFTGGGIRNAEDLRQLRQCGGDHFLVATALLETGG